LSRLKADAARQQLDRAGRAMADAQQRMQQGERGDEEQEDALEKLDRAQDQLQQQRQQVEDELMREKVEKATALIKGIREQQNTVNETTKRVHDAAMKAKAWPKERLQTLIDQIEVENRLADDAARLAENQFKSVSIAAKMLEQSADAMRMAARRLDARRKDILDRPPDEPFDPKLEQKLQDDIVKWQEVALRRLDQFLDALKPDKDAKRPSGEQPQGGGGQQPPMGGGRRPSGDEVPLLAQLKALRSLQAEVIERTTQFAKDHPDLSKLTEEEKEDLAVIRKMQRDIADLIQEYGAADEPKGDKP
jgi:hypothetical protein